MKQISLLGSTGSIGTQTLDVIRDYPDQFTLSALACGTNLELCRNQIKEFQPKLVSVQRPEDAQTLAGEFGDSIEFLYGEEGLNEVARYSESDIVVTAITGSIGLLPTLSAIKAKKQSPLPIKKHLSVRATLLSVRQRKTMCRSFLWTASILRFSKR